MQLDKSNMVVCISVSATSSTKLPLQTKKNTYSPFRCPAMQTDARIPTDHESSTITNTDVGDWLTHMKKKTTHSPQYNTTSPPEPLFCTNQHRTYQNIK
jgi:hypothetical protein